jgi:hypothetical protein
MGESTVMLSVAKHLTAQRDRPFAALRVTVEGPMMLLICISCQYSTTHQTHIDLLTVSETHDN